MTEADKTERTNFPKHVAIIMDGNGRWAEERGLERKEGHRAGAESIRPVIQRLGDHKIPVVTLFGFSTENWGRPQFEVDAIFRLGGHFIDQYLDELHDRDVRLQHLGQIEALPDWLVNKVESAVAKTRLNRGMILNLAFNYGARAEIVNAVREAIERDIPSQEITESLFESLLQTANLPAVDLLIRTGNSRRISNFLLWQVAYAEIYFSKLYWPDFGAEDVDAALSEYAQTQRTFGLVPETMISSTESR
ncbi:MAG: polyprenyl diphosphate synthase [Chloroflexota bacterium]|nr:polyprenyl diphosphate synthase [Chloroflexota bacterium]